jgi:DNA repair exonuclease SbcCD ATPase subunit
MKIFRILKEDDSEHAAERRLEKEWELGPNTPLEGLKAHALFNFLVDNSDLTPITNQEKKELTELESKLVELQNQLTELEKNGEDTEDIEDEIETIQDDISELTSRDDVYKIVPTGEFYDMTEFEVIDGGLEGNRYAVGDESEVKSSAEERVEQLIDEIGYEGFSDGFARSYIDTDKVVDYAEDVYNDDVYNNPEVYLDDEDRMLSSEQNEKISVLNYKISRLEENISDLEDKLGGDYEEEVKEKIEQLEKIIDEYNEEISDIEDDPDGDWPEEVIEEKIAQMLRRVQKDPENFLEEMGSRFEDFIDKDKFIEDVIDADGYGHTLNGYNGSIDEVYINNILFYVMRID